jgi:hypothetical protein
MKKTEGASFYVVTTVIGFNVESVRMVFAPTKVAAIEAGAERIKRSDAVLRGHSFHVVATPLGVLVRDAQMIGGA